GGLFVVIGIALLFQLSARINRKPGIMHIGSFAYVDPSKRSIDVHVLVLVVIVVLFHIDAASSEQYESRGERKENRKVKEIAHSSSNACGPICGLFSLPTPWFPLPGPQFPES